MKKIKEGDAFFASGEIDKAVGSWEESLDIKKTAAAYEKMIIAHIVKNDLSGAEQWLKEGLVHFPDNVNLIFNASLISYHKNEYQLALKDIDRVLDADMYYPNAHYMKGMIYEKLGNDKEAKKEFVNAININPGSRATWEKIREEVKNGK
ncbi:MAG TPA: tetratricopeptide repeat protein [bacterium]|nr:tetratricopeptide repeat protein [bacterium]